MDAMWTVYGYEPDSDEPHHPNSGQVPLLRERNAGWFASGGPLQIAGLPAAARAFRDAVAESKRAGPNPSESPQHDEVLAAFLEYAVATGQAVTVEVWWG